MLSAFCYDIIAKIFFAVVSSKTQVSFFTGTSLICRQINTVMLILFQIDIVQLVTSFRLSVLNASQNNISVLYSTVEVIRDLRKLQNLYLHVSLSIPITAPIDENNTFSSSTDMVR